MSLGIVARTWAIESDDVDAGWTGEQEDTFKALMEAASIKPRGMPALVCAWSRSRSRICWYNARAGKDEVVLRDKCRAIFGVRERHMGEDWRTWGKVDEGPSPQRRLP